MSYETKTNIDGLGNLLSKIAPKMKMLEQNRKEYELLPGLQELQGSELSEDLRGVLVRGDEIREKFRESEREYGELRRAVE